MNFRALAIVALSLMGCVHHVTERCPSCVVVDGERPMLPRVREGVKRVVVIVPGGHTVLWDALEETADAVRTFLSA